jgi:hypothetical protein
LSTPAGIKTAMEQFAAKHPNFPLKSDRRRPTLMLPCVVFPDVFDRAVALAAVRKDLFRPAKTTGTAPRWKAQH